MSTDVDMITDESTTTATDVANAIATGYIQVRHRLVEEKINEMCNGSQEIIDDSQINNVPINECPKDHVAITIPWFYVNCDEFSEHRSVDNLYFINYHKLCEIMTCYMDIENGDNDTQIDSVCPKLFKLLKTKEKHIDDNDKVTSTIYKQIQVILSSIQLFGNFQSLFEVDDEFVDISHETISFNTIRQYKNDDMTGLLLESKEHVVNGYHFYSQVPTNEEKMHIRELTMETDLNQMYFILQKFKDSLLFKPNRVCNYTSKIISICILYLVLESHAIPVRGHYLYYADTNIISFMIDCIIRSRVLSHWKNNPCTRQLINDLMTNYNKINLLVSVCRFDTARERAQFLCEQIKRRSNVSKALSYNEYEQLIKRYVTKIDNVSYYNFDKIFLLSLVELPSFMTIIDTAIVATAE